MDDKKALLSDSLKGFSKKVREYLLNSELEIEKKEIFSKRFSRVVITFRNKKFDNNNKTIKITTRSDRISDFLTEILKINESLLLNIKSIKIKYYLGNEFRRGVCLSSSIIELDKNFAEEIKITGSFRWIDKRWGCSTAELSYDLSRLK